MLPRQPQRISPGRLVRLFTLRYKHRSSECFAQLLREVRELHGERKPKIFVMGGGEIGIGMERARADASGVRWVETDIYRGSRTEIICDAHDLPFRDGCFDAVVSQSVLEHVRSPQRVAQEAERVVRVGAPLFVQAAFMQQIHEGPADFFRFTPRALRFLFPYCEVVTWGASQGVGTALAWSVRFFLRALIGRIRGGRALSYLLYCLLLPFGVMFDWLTRHNPLAMEAASEFYLYLRRQRVLDPQLDQFPHLRPE